MNFSELGLAAPILRALQDEGYTQPTPIQTKAIPGVLAGRDLLGIAQTGTGKTAAFALPILHRLAANRRPALRKGCRVLVLTPTRELASQIAESFRTYGRHLGMTVAVVFGGVGHRPQIQALARGVDVLVATPGRLLDHIAARDIVLSGTEVLVLDEADQMLDLGFLPPIRRIVAQLTSKRQNLFFSATMPHEIGKLADELLRDPVGCVTPSASTVDSYAARAASKVTKARAAGERVFDPRMSRALVFTRTAGDNAHHLEMAGISVAAIHGNKSQSQRERALAAFRAAKIRVLVATDIAARGIDIDQVTHVVNFELPDVPESYVHRIGRTARAGAAGIAISLCDVEERDLLRDIERLTRQPIPAEDRRLGTTRGSDVSAQRQSHRGNGRGPGNRGADDQRASNRKRQQQAPHGRQQQGDNRGFRSAAGPARHRGAPKQSAGRAGSSAGAR